MTQRNNEITKKIQEGIDPEDIDDQFKEEMEIAEECMKRYKNTLRKLAKEDKE